MTIPGGLLNDSAVAKLLASMTGGANMPGATTVQRPEMAPAGLPQGGLLAPPTPGQAQAMPQASAQGPMHAPQAPNPGDNTHDHQGGFTGGVRHLLGVDRIQPEVAALLTPDQQKRATPGVANTLWSLLTQGEGAGTIQKERAAEMLGLMDLKKQRDTTAAHEQTWKQIQAAAGPISTDPQQAQAQMEWIARSAAAAGIPQAEITRLAASQLAPSSAQPLVVSRGAAVRKPDGTWEIPSPIPVEKPVSNPIQVRTKDASGNGVVRSVDERTGQVFWEMPAPPETSAFANRPPTEVESKDYVYAGLMRNAMPDIRATSDFVRPEVMTAMRIDPIGMSGIVLTDKERVFRRAVLEFAAASNRKESGAAITPSEVANTLDRYVDTGFDGPPGSPVRRAKAKARENYLRLLDNTSARARDIYEGGDGQGNAPPAGKPMSAAAYREARAAGYTDAEIRAEGFIIPGAP